MFTLVLKSPDRGWPITYTIPWFASNKLLYKANWASLAIVSWNWIRMRIVLVALNLSTPFHPINLFSQYYLWSCCLSETKNERKFKTFGSENGRGRLRRYLPKVVPIWLWNFWYFGKVVAEEIWLLTRSGRNQRFSCVVFFFKYIHANLLLYNLKNFSLLNIHQ